VAAQKGGEAMKEIGTLYRADGEVLEVHPAKGRKFQLPELQKHVGGYIELVPGTAKRGKPIAFCNEEGNLHGLPWNRVASLKFGINLVGDVIQVRKEK
jgi:hypothetical protein